MLASGRVVQHGGDRVRSTRLLFTASILLLAIVPACAYAAPPMSIGGGPLLGGYLGDLRHDWPVGAGVSAFLEAEIESGIDLRLAGSIQWNDGSLRPWGIDRSSADLGGRVGESPRSFRRSTIAACAIHRLESRAYRDFLVPYAGMGVEYAERSMTFDAPDFAHGRRVIGRDGGLLAIAGLRFYRTSGLFVSLEGRLHGLDTPQEWTAAYDVSMLVGAQLGL